MSLPVDFWERFVLNVLLLYIFLSLIFLNGFAVFQDLEGITVENV